MKIEEIIKRSGKTYEEVQREAQISQRQLFRIRKGTSEPTASVIIRLCDALGCAADELLGRDKKTHPPKERKAQQRKRETTVIVKNNV